jgi:hypothetical protein
MGNKNPGGADGAAPRVRNGQSKKSSATDSQTIAATQAPVTKPALQSVYSGRECIGRIVCRGKLGFEAYDSDERSLGIFPNLKRAADAVSAAGVAS